MITNEEDLMTVIDYLIMLYCPDRSLNEIKERALYEQTDAYQDELARERDGDARCDEKRDEGI